MIRSLNDFLKWSDAKISCHQNALILKSGKMACDQFFMQYSIQPFSFSPALTFSFLPVLPASLLLPFSLLLCPLFLPPSASISFSPLPPSLPYFAPLSHLSPSHRTGWLNQLSIRFPYVVLLKLHTPMKH